MLKNIVILFNKIMEPYVNSDVNFITDDNAHEYEQELYNYMCSDTDDIEYNQVYYTDATNYKNNIYSLENIRRNQVEETIFIKLAGHGDYQISIYKVKKPNNFIGELMGKFFKAHENKINNYLLRIIHLESVRNGIYFDRIYEYEKIKKQNNQNKSFIPQRFEQMCILLGLEIRTYSNARCKYEDKIVIVNNIVSNIFYEPINLYKFIHGIIFNHGYSDMINYKIIKDDGNFILAIFEFKNCYYIMDYSTS